MTIPHLCLFSIVCFFFLVFDVVVEAVTTCYNYESCRDQTISGEYMYCYSELACSDSLLLNGCCSSNRARDCMGDYSCSNSNWYNASWFGAYSPFTLYNTTIYNSGVTLNGWILGYYAAYNTTIYCYNSSSCTVTCNGNACINFNLICDDTSTCAIAGTRLYVSISNGENYYRGGLPMMNAISESSIVSDAYNGGKNCNNYLGNCDYTTLTISQSFYNIYCKAYRACYNSNININNGKNNSGVYCSAHNSCYGTTMKVINSGGNGMYNNNNTAYCGSAYSCIDSKFVGFNKVYGMGYTALENTIIVSNGDNNEMNVYFASYYAGTGAKIYCNFTDTCNIYCDAYYSCLDVTAYCFGTCNVYCNSAINGVCISVNDYSQSPTSEPTALSIASVITSTQMSSEVTTTTAAAAAAAVTRSASTTTEMGMAGIGQTTENTRDDNNNDNNNNNNNGDDGGDDDNLSSQTESSQLGDWSKTWEIGGYVCLVISLGAPFIIVILSHFYHKQEKFKYCDKPNYFAIFACFWNFGDFYSDLIFTFVLITTENTLWYFAVFFALIPHFVSNFVSLWNIRKWQTYSIYIAKYINRYDSLIIFVSVLAGFYTSVELARSKLFYLNMFSMQLKNQDYAQLQQFRFFNTVLFENIPQFVIQIIYTYETGSLDIFVLSAMIFSVLSAMISISEQLKRRMKHDGSAAARLHYRAKKTFKMKIKSDAMGSHHKYIHKTLTKALCAALGIDNTGNIEVFYVINIRNGIMAYIQVSNIIVDSELCDTGLEDDKATLFAKMKKIDDTYCDKDAFAGNNNNNNNNNNVNRMLKQEIAERLHLSDVKIPSSEGGAKLGEANDGIENDLTSIILNMEISMEVEKAGLSVDSDAIDIKSKRSVDSSSTYGMRVMRSISSSPSPRGQAPATSFNNFHNTNNTNNNRKVSDMDGYDNNNNNNNDNIQQQQHQLQQQMLQMQMQMQMQQWQFEQQKQQAMNMNMNNNGAMIMMNPFINGGAPGEGGVGGGAAPVPPVPPPPSAYAVNMN